MIGAVDLAHRHHQTAAPRYAEMRKAIAVRRVGMKERNVHQCSAAVADGGRDKRKRDPGMVPEMPQEMPQEMLQEKHQEKMVAGVPEVLEMNQEVVKMMTISGDAVPEMTVARKMTVA